MSQHIELFAEAIKELKNSEGATDIAFKKRNRSFKGFVRILKSRFINILIQLRGKEWEYLKKQ